MRLIRRRRRGLVLLAVAIMVALSGSSAVAAVPPGSQAAAEIPPEDPPPPDAPVVADPASSPTTLSRGSGTVTVSRTANLTRQMLNVSWTGMEPSAQASGGTLLPVAVMQCRGHNPDRSDCWMASPVQGGELAAFAGSSYLPPENTQWKLIRPVPSGMTYRIPFRKADGTYHAAPHPSIPDAWLVRGIGAELSTSTIDDYTPGTANQRVGFTRPNGTGEAQTWANTKAENPSLGCSSTSPCSLVVVPVKLRPCRKADYVGQTEANRCATAQAGAGPAKTAGYWQLLANWYERYVFKLSFAPEATACEQRDDSAKFLGSEVMAEAMRRWVPDRCQPSSPTGLDYTRAWEPESRTQFGQPDPIAPSGFTADATIVSEPSPSDAQVVTKRKPAYAPVGVSGFAIGFNWDKQASAGGGQVPDMKLNARLVAKLLTQSYPGKYRVGPHGHPVNPNAPTNPTNMLQDPEFQQLNPGADQWAGSTSSGAGTQMAIPVARTDVMLALTRWIWSDPSARAFVQGKADPWGMTVNKTYRSWPMPRDDYELNDGWAIPDVPGVGAGWPGFSPQTLGAQSSTSWANGTDAAMTAWPLNQVPTRPNDQTPFQPKRDLAQDPGFRHVLTLSTTSELEKAGLRAASLQNSEGAFIAASVDSLTYALDGATVDQATGVWRINHATMELRGYPGTMISYAQVPTTTLKGEAPKRYADTLRWMSTDGQAYGVEAGQLPAGYLALTDPMREQAAKVAAAVEKQTGTPVIPPKDEDPLPDDDDPTPDDPPADNPDDPGQQTGGSSQNGDDNTTTPGGSGDGSNGSGNGDGNGTGSGNGDNEPSATPTTPGSTPTTPGSTPTSNSGKNQPQANGSTKPVSATTQGDSLGWLAWGIPALLVAGLAAGVASPGIRLIAQPDHPVRRGVVAGSSYLAALVRRGRRRNG